MKYLLLTLLIVQNIYAYEAKKIIESNPDCNGEVNVSENYVVIKAETDSLKVFDLNEDRTLIISSIGVIRDFDISDNNLFVLTDSGFYQYDLLENAQIFATNFYKQVGFINTIKFITGKLYFSTNTDEILVFSLYDKAFIDSIKLNGKTQGITSNEKYILIYSNFVGVIEGKLYNSIYIFDIFTQSLVKEVKIISGPSEHIEFVGDDVYIGKEIQWQLKLNQLFNDELIKDYNSLFVPSPKATGAINRDISNIYYCQKEIGKIKVLNRKFVEK